MTVGMIGALAPRDEQRPQDQQPANGAQPTPPPAAPVQPGTTGGGTIAVGGQPAVTG
jgi:hypothetical protein